MWPALIIIFCQCTYKYTSVYIYIYIKVEYTLNVGELWDSVWWNFNFDEQTRKLNQKVYQYVQRIIYIYILCIQIIYTTGIYIYISVLCTHKNDIHKIYIYTQIKVS